MTSDVIVMNNTLKLPRMQLDVFANRSLHDAPMSTLQPRVPLIHSFCVVVNQSLGLRILEIDSKPILKKMLRSVSTPSIYEFPARTSVLFPNDKSVVPNCQYKSPASFCWTLACCQAPTAWTRVIFDVLPNQASRSASSSQPYYIQHMRSE